MKPKIVSSYFDYFALFYDVSLEQIDIQLGLKCKFSILYMMIKNINVTGVAPDVTLMIIVRSQRREQCK